jgi:hypothetical protein
MFDLTTLTMPGEEYKLLEPCVRFEVLTAVTMKSRFFWVVKSVFSKYTALQAKRTYSSYKKFLLVPSFKED